MSTPWTEALYAASKLAPLPFSEAEIAAEQIGGVEQLSSTQLRHAPSADLSPIFKTAGAIVATVPASINCLRIP